MGAYGDFAKIYDALMDDYDYDAWTQFYLSLLARKGVQPKEICECACGTGSFSVRLAKKGIKVLGVDLSAEMLREAGDKARRNGVRVMFIQSDMSKLKLGHPVDALICPCDGVNYLTTNEGLKAFFDTAYRSIKPGGAFAFDISSEYKLTRILGDNFFGEERDDMAYLWSNAFDEKKRTVDMQLTFFTREPNGLFRRFHEQHTQRAYTAEELTQALKLSGFDDIEIFGDKTFDLPRADDIRIHISARRVEEK